MSKASTSNNCSSVKIPCLCPDGCFCSIETSRTPKNPGRRFGKCRKANFTNKGCRIWCWLDEVRICDCGKWPCKVMKSNKDYSKGRRFYCCPQSIDAAHPSCGHFSWIDESKCGLSATKKVLVEASTSEGSKIETENKESKAKAENLRLILVEYCATKRYMELISSMMEKLDMNGSK